MTNEFRATPLAQHRRCAGPLGAYIAGLGALLDARGYARATEKQQLQCVAEFSRWLARRRLEIADVDERRGTEFVRAPRRRGRVGRGDGTTLRTLFEHLRQLGVIPAPPPAVDPTELSRVEQAFGVYLARSEACRARR